MNKTSYYVTGNTAKGLVNFLPSNLKDINNVIVLQHRSNRLKTAVIQQMIDYYKNTSHIEVILSPKGSEYLDGVIVREKSIAILDSTIAEPIAQHTSIIPLEDLLHELHVQNSSTNQEFSNIDHLLQKYNEYHQEAYKSFATGLNIHDDLERIFIKEMDFKRADQIADEFVKNLLKDASKQHKTSHIFHRLFGTSTAEGAVNVVPEILDELGRSYFIKGRAGTGKSTFMKKVLTACQQYGFDIELYHCSFDPGSVDMVLVRDLDFCIFDSTDPHEVFPSKDGHIVIDMYEETVKPGTDERYADDIHRVNKKYKSYMKTGVAQLKKAKEYLDQVEDMYKYVDKDIEKVGLKIQSLL